MSAPGTSRAAPVPEESTTCRRRSSRACPSPVAPFPGRRGRSVDAKTLRTQERVEELYEKGDYNRAFFNYRNELAPIGDKYAQYMVGYMYLTGTGVEEDPLLASAWYRLAAERSYKEFLNERDHLLSLFSDVDLVRSDALYLQLRREYSDVVLLLELVKDDIDMLVARTGSIDSRPVSMATVTPIGRLAR